MQIEQVGEDKGEQYQFVLLQNNILQEKELAQKLMQWGLKDSLKVEKYRFNLKFEVTRIEELVKGVLEKRGMKVEGGVKIENMRTSCLDMGFFDRLEQQGITSPGGLIRQCFPEQFKGIEVADQLRQCLLQMEDSEHVDVFDQCDQQELLYWVFRVLVLGGGVCQYEDNVQSYLDMAKCLYKALVTVKRDSTTQQVFIHSHAVNVLSVPNQFPLDSHDPHIQNILLVIINPSLMEVNILSNYFQGFW